tara:strand:+ start:123 stop:704 length:582 start_codon:yes stop_codon:yes gene_type:complete
VNIRPLFPTPVAYFPNFITSKERLDIFKSIKNISHHSHGAIEGDGVSTHKPDCTTPKFLKGNIKQRIQDAIDEYGKEWGCEGSKISQIWSNTQNSGSRLLEHIHPHSVVSGALYINVDDSCKITFYNPNPYAGIFPIDIPTPYNHESQYFWVHNCELVLFPGWLRHGRYRDVNEMDDRIVVSFNSYPKISFSC